MRGGAGGTENGNEVIFATAPFWALDFLSGRGDGGERLQYGGLGGEGGWGGLHAWGPASTCMGAEIRSFRRVENRYPESRTRLTDARGHLLLRENKVSEAVIAGIYSMTTTPPS